MSDGSGEKFCLRWNDFERNISKEFQELKDDEDFCDVTLACDDNQLQAHKVILSACSPFFKNILKKNPHQHPLLYLKGVKYEYILSVLNFMYHGEVNVAQEELNSFLAVAEDLQVKGLSQNKEICAPAKQAVQPAKPAVQTAAKQVRPDKPHQAMTSYHTVIKTEQEHPEPAECDTDMDTPDLLVDNNDYLAEHDGYQYAQDYHEQDMYGVAGVQMEEVDRGSSLQGSSWNNGWKEKNFSCDICFKNFSSRNSLLNHQGVHKGLTTCTYCQKVFGTTSSMNFHMKNAHGNPN